MKRIVLFLVTNIAVMLVLSVSARILGIDRYLTANGDMVTLTLIQGVVNTFAAGSPDCRSEISKLNAATSKVIGLAY